MSDSEHWFISGISVSHRLFLPFLCITFLIVILFCRFDLCMTNFFSGCHLFLFLISANFPFSRPYLPFLSPIFFFLALIHLFYIFPHLSTVIFPLRREFSCCLSASSCFSLLLSISCSRNSFLSFFLFSFQSVGFAKKSPAPKGMRRKPAQKIRNPVPAALFRLGWCSCTCGNPASAVDFLRRRAGEILRLLSEIVHKLCISASQSQRKICGKCA